MTVHQPRRHSSAPRAWLVAITLIAGFVAGCGGDEATAPPVDLSPAAEAGRSIATEAGCNACHGGQGEGGVGPAWAGLAGSEVTLADGSTVVADAAYLARAITEPDADFVEGYSLRMPANDLSPADVDAIVAYIEELP